MHIRGKVLCWIVQFSRHRVARIAIQIGKVNKVAEVAVANTLGFPALLGTDL